MTMVGMMMMVVVMMMMVVMMRMTGSLDRGRDTSSTIPTHCKWLQAEVNQQWSYPSNTWNSVSVLIPIHQLPHPQPRAHLEGRLNVNFPGSTSLCHTPHSLWSWQVLVMITLSTELSHLFASSGSHSSPVWLPTNQPTSGSRSILTLSRPYIMSYWPVLMAPYSASTPVSFDKPVTQLQDQLQWQAQFLPLPWQKVLAADVLEGFIQKNEYNFNC